VRVRARAEGVRVYSGAALWLQMPSTMDCE